MKNKPTRQSSKKQDSVSGMQKKKGSATSHPGKTAVGETTDKQRYIVESHSQSDRQKTTKGHPRSVRKGTADAQQQVEKHHHLTRAQATEIAIYCYSGYTDKDPDKDPDKGRRRPVEELADKCQEWWDIRPASITLHRRITEAFRKKWVQVVPGPGDGTAAGWEKDEDLAKALLAKYQLAGLRDVLVVDIDQPPDTNLVRVEDPFYQALGAATAERLVRDWIRPQDIVGVGSGRAVYNTVNSLERYAPLNIPDLRLMSLTGRVWSRPDPELRLASWMDADFHVALFWGMCNDAQPFYIGHPLTYPATRRISEQEEDPRSGTSLSRDSWNGFRPTVAIQGVGTVLRNHRYWVSDESDKRKYDPFLRPVHDELRKLVALFERELVALFEKTRAPDAQNRQGRPNYSPVADTANHLFLVPHPDPTVAKIFKYDLIRETIAQINKKLLVVSEDQFKQIPAIVLVAGTAEKAYAIRELLVNPNYPITWLCTDTNAAQALLKMKD